QFYEILALVPAEPDWLAVHVPMSPSHTARCRLFSSGAFYRRACVKLLSIHALWECLACGTREGDSSPRVSTSPPWVPNWRPSDNPAADQLGQAVASLSFFLIDRLHGLRAIGEEPDL